MAIERHTTTRAMIWWRLIPMLVGIVALGCRADVAVSASPTMAPELEVPATIGRDARVSLPGVQPGMLRTMSGLVLTRGG